MKVMFATPAYRGLNCLPYLDSLEKTVELLGSKGIEVTFKLLTGNCYIQVARNIIAKEFIDSDCDKLFFLDDDISWNAQDALDLCNMKYPIVAGVYPVKKENADYPVVLRSNNKHQVIQNPDGTLQATRVPTGFLCIDRLVLEIVACNYPHLYYYDHATDEYYFDFFPQGVKDGVWVGEDFAFCDLCTSVGVTIAVKPDIEFKHHSEDKYWEGSLLTFLKQLPGG